MTQHQSRHVSIYNCRLTSIGISISKVRRSHERFFRIQEITISRWDGSYIDIMPWDWDCASNFLIIDAIKCVLRQMCRRLICLTKNNLPSHDQFSKGRGDFSNWEIFTSFSKIVSQISRKVFIITMNQWSGARFIDERTQYTGAIHKNDICSFLNKSWTKVTLFECLLVLHLLVVYTYSFFKYCGAVIQILIAHFNASLRDISFSTYMLMIFTINHL